MIDSGNDLSLVWQHTITVDLLLTGPLGILKWNFNENTIIFIEANAKENVVCKMPTILFQPDVLSQYYVLNFPVTMTSIAIINLVRRQDPCGLRANIIQTHNRPHNASILWRDKTQPWIYLIETERAMSTILSSLSGVPDFLYRNKILSGYDLSHYQVPHCIRVFFYFVWFVFIHHNFQFYFKLCTYCNILDINLS